MDLNYQALTTEDLGSSRKNQINLSEFNRQQIIVEQQVCASDSSSVQKMCNFICSCFTCFQRPDEKKHEYNYVPESKTTKLVATKADNKRNQKSILK